MRMIAAVSCPQVSMIDVSVCAQDRRTVALVSLRTSCVH